jgi:hypothetical protein
MDVSRAQLSNLGDAVVLVDPGFPWTVRVQVDHVDGRPAVTSLAVEARDRQPITSSVLAQVPVRQLAGLVASALAGEGESHYRMLAQPRPAGQSWPPEHFERVARVATWARATSRPGGAAGTVAEFWGVHYRTARRWIARLRASDRPPVQTP